MRQVWSQSAGAVQAELVGSATLWLAAAPPPGAAADALQWHDIVDARYSMTRNTLISLHSPQAGMA